MNRLGDATSPYLRQHAENPVDWWPWSPEAFAEARRRNVPVHLSIGYAACHWCHVMASESFSNPAIAAILNRDFVSIKVDREERPEVDQIYMRALHALGEQGGWPLTMFLTPKAHPFWGGTYFPPEPRWGRPGFPQILAGISAAWQSQDAAVIQNSAALLEHLNRREAAPAGSPDPGVVDRAAEKLLSIWDMQRGSFRGAPKFPNAAVLEALWRTGLRTGAPAPGAAVLTTLTYLCQGGIYDHLAGGLSRYSVDAAWKVPHFEKMLYDNALFLSLLSYAFRATGQPLFRSRIDETASWLIRDMQLPHGGFASSLDADTDHEEGLTYVWSWEELQALLGNALPTFAELYDASPGGNWEGKIILNRLAPGSLDWLGDEREEMLQGWRRTLLSHRTTRPQPAQDDKTLADWNGLAIAGLARAARALGNKEYAQAAARAFRFVAGSMSESGRLSHSFRNAVAVGPGLATDYANMISAAIELYSLTGDLGYLGTAETWYAAADLHHFDPESNAYRLTADDADPLIAIPLSVTDEATPAATGIMLSNAATLFALTGDDAYRIRAESLVEGLAARVERDVVGTASLQAGYDNLLRARIAMLAGPAERLAPLLAQVLGEGDPALVITTFDPATMRPDHPAAGKQPSRSGAALFLCDALRCLPEITDPAEIGEALRATRRGLA